MDVPTLAARLGVPPKAAARAQELVKLAAAKLGTGGPGVNCRAAVCLELACAATKHFVDREQLVRLSGANKKVYLATLGALGGALDARPVVTCAELALKFGAPALGPAAERLLATYKARLVAPLGQRAAQADFTRPAFPAAAFFLACRASKVPVDRSQLCSAVGIASSDLSPVLASMQELCAASTGGQSGQKRARPRSDIPDTRGEEEGGERPRKRGADAASSPMRMQRPAPLSPNRRSPRLHSG